MLKIETIEDLRKIFKSKSFKRIWKSIVPENRIHAYVLQMWLCNEKQTCIDDLNLNLELKTFIDNYNRPTLGKLTVEQQKVIEDKLLKDTFVAKELSLEPVSVTQEHGIELKNIYMESEYDVDDDEFINPLTKDHSFGGMENNTLTSASKYIKEIFNYFRRRENHLVSNANVFVLREGNNTFEKVNVYFRMVGFQFELLDIIDESGESLDLENIYIPIDLQLKVYNLELGECDCLFSYYAVNSKGDLIDIKDVKFYIDYYNM